MERHRAVTIEGDAPAFLFCGKTNRKSKSLGNSKSLSKIPMQNQCLVFSRGSEGEGVNSCVGTHLPRVGAIT
jgi:hypothetical protein